MRLRLLTTLAFGVAATATVWGQTPPARPPRQSAPPPSREYGKIPPPTAPAKVEKTGDSTLRIGAVRVDLAKKEVSVDGTINDVPVLEFIANTREGYKAYESAIETQTTAIDFNLGLILIGLDRDRAVRPRFHFDPLVPQGDPVEVSVSWTDGGVRRRVPADDLVYDMSSKKTLPRSQWVYTGSQFLPKSTAFLADLDGVLIGFVHTPAPLIERVEAVPGPYGAARVNPELNLKPGTTVTVTVRALPRKTP